MDLGLKGKRALVMGGSKGLGRSIADAIAAEGAIVTVSGREQASLDKVAAELKALGAQAAYGIQADVSSGAEMVKLADAAIAAMVQHQNIHAPHGGDCRIGKLIHLSAGGNIGLNAIGRLGAECLQFSGHLIKACLFAPADRDNGALGGDGIRDGTPEAL